MVRKSIKFCKTTNMNFEEDAISHLDTLYRTALHMTRNVKDAEDLVQDVYLKAFGSRSTFATGSNMRAWLLKILSNDFISKIRRYKREPARTELDDVIPFIEDRKNTVNPVETFDDTPGLTNIQDSEIRRTVEELPRDYRLVFVLALVEDLSYREITQILDVPMGTVMSRLHRAKKVLREKLEHRSHRWSRVSIS